MSDELRIVYVILWPFWPVVVVLLFVFVVFSFGPSGGKR